MPFSRGTDCGFLGGGLADTFHASCLFGARHAASTAFSWIQNVYGGSGGAPGPAMATLTFFTLTALTHRVTFISLTLHIEAAAPHTTTLSRPTGPLVDTGAFPVDWSGSIRTATSTIRICIPSTAIKMERQAGGALEFCRRGATNDSSACQCAVRALALFALLWLTQSGRADRTESPCPTGRSSSPTVATPHRPH